MKHKRITQEEPQSQYGTAASRWAGVGPYYAMFPVTFATAAVREYTEPGNSVFDPFAGRGTALFSAASEGRFGFGIEINPVGWVYGKAKLQTAERLDVERRIEWLGQKAKNYRDASKHLPEFFHHCFSKEVREFLVAARSLLDWKRTKVDWTTMALLMVDLHGKRKDSLSNQMRQTKAMSPQYAIDWWRERDLQPPKRNPVDFMKKKLAWRYAKGRVESGSGQVFLGDCRAVLTRWESSPPNIKKANLLLTSPPYSGVTNYFYDQWIRFWLLGGPERPHSLGTPHTKKFGDKKYYTAMLQQVFLKSRGVLAKNAVIHVRTDARQFTRQASIEALETAFPNKKLRLEKHSRPDFTQTALFDSALKTEGEIDYVMW